MRRFYLSMPPRQTYLTSRNSSMPYFPPSRPMPDCFTPPKGAISVEMIPGKETLHYKYYFVIGTSD